MNVQHLRVGIVSLCAALPLLVGCGDSDDPAVTDTQEVAQDTREPDSTDPGDTAVVADSGGGEVSDTTSPSCPMTVASVPGVTVVKDGRFHTIKALAGQDVGPRDVTVFLPVSYDTVAAADARYPVLYAHDGQNLFFAEKAAFGVEWGLDEALDAALTAEAIPGPVIVVALDNTSERIPDYTPTSDPSYGGGNAAAYGAYLVDVVKPAIDALYRTRCAREDTAVMGSSLGGLVSFYLGLEYPDVFGRVAAVSPSFWWNGEALVDVFDSYEGPLPDRLWIDMGTREGETNGDLTPSIARVRHARDRAIARGGRIGLGLGYLEAPGGAHNEASWRARLPAILVYLFGPQATTVSQPESLAIGLFSNPLAVGKTTNLGVNARYADGRRLTIPNPEAGLDWVMGGAARLDDSGHVEAVSPGETVVTASYQAVAATATITVGPGGGSTAVTFEVDVPVSTPSSDTIYLTGDQAVLSAWDPAGVAMTSVSAGRWSVTLQIADGQRFEYKYTRGSWPQVEVAASGDDIGNRSATATGVAMTLQDTVQRWHDGGP